MQELNRVPLNNRTDDLSSLGYAWLKIRRNLAHLLGELFHHPSAMLGLVLLLSFVFMSIFASYIAPHDPNVMDMEIRIAAPDYFGGDNFLGTDQLGRDILSRIIYGAKMSLSIGIIATGISLAVGVFLGLLAGYYQGWIDVLLSRLADLLLAFPYLIFAIWAMAALGAGFWNLIIALTFKGWVEFYRLVRGEVLSEKTREYADAAIVSGKSGWGVMFTEIMPNIFHSIIVLGTLRMGTMIIMEASLSFLGLGVNPSIPAWGGMINAGRSYIWNAWWIATMPGLALLTLVMAINLLGEGLRDILDPRQKVQ